jgi:hypothetical protein
MGMNADKGAFASTRLRTDLDDIATEKATLRAIGDSKARCRLLTRL